MKKLLVTDKSIFGKVLQEQDSLLISKIHFRYVFQDSIVFLIENPNEQKLRGFSFDSVYCIHNTYINNYKLFQMTNCNEIIILREC